MLPAPMIAVVMVHSFGKPRFVVPLVLGSCSCFLLRFQRRVCWGSLRALRRVRQCAAAFDQVTVSNVDAATWRHVQAVNVESALWLVQAFTRGMADRRFGRIVFITSDTFWALPSALLAYVASKGAAGVMRTLAVT